MLFCFVISVYLRSFPAGWGVQGQSLSLTNFCTWHKRNVLLGQKLLGIKLWLHHVCSLTIEGLLARDSEGEVCCPSPAGTPRQLELQQALQHSLPPISCPPHITYLLTRWSFQKALSSPYPDFFKMHLKKKNKNLLEAEIYLKLQRLSQFLFLSTEVLCETERHIKNATK